MNPNSGDKPPVPVATVTAIVLIWYCLTIVASRLITHVIAPGISVESGGLYHWHHIIWGLVLMAVGGFFGLYWSERLPIMAGSWFLGMGLGLAVDEKLLVGARGADDIILEPVLVDVSQSIDLTTEPVVGDLAYVASYQSAGLA